MIAVSGGLVASLGMQATASPAGPQVTTASTTSEATAATSAIASGAPGSLGSGVIIAPKVSAASPPRVAHAQFGQVGFTATAAPKPKPSPKTAPTADQTAVDQTVDQAAQPTAGAGEKARTRRPFGTVSRSSGRRSTTSSTQTSDATSTESGGSDPSTNDPSTNDPSTNDPGDGSSAGSGAASIKAGAPGSADFGAAVLSIASRYDGIAYRYGGTTPAGFDCSGFTSYVFAQVGTDLPRTSGAQRAAATRISRGEAVPGDLVFMPGHVGIYAGNGMMWDSPRSGLDVSKRPVYSSSATYGRVG